MNACGYNSKLSAYLDGELPLQEHEAVARHVASCPVCASELSCLQGLGVALRQWSAPQLSPAALKRIHMAIEQGNFRRFERLVISLAGMAACLAIAAVIWSETASASPTVAAAWERAAITSSTEDTLSNNTQDLSLAKWVVADLTSGD